MLTQSPIYLLHTGPGVSWGISCVKMGSTWPEPGLNLALGRLLTTNNAGSFRDLAL
ncbi:hypothetical protein BofuT4_uP105590.1 [Botrytis cinerea T4]|uniref:Uncharacterized protein n=1 Tax=Botryotinia fuckeliana (strain T4) TaxID=999810 RepID=G2Y8J4_BOTF4|nr:hypothetical protein BofuT4_uP105590.1 [Botrytis cinerea T4]